MVLKMEIKDLSEEQLKEVYTLTGKEFKKLLIENGVKVSHWCKEYGLSYTSIYEQQAVRNKMNMKAVTCLIEEIGFNDYYISLKMIREEIENEKNKKAKNEK